MNRIAVGTWVEFLKDYQGAKAQDQCKVQCNIQGGLYVTNQRGGQIYSLEFLKSRGIIEIMKGDKNNYNTDVSTLAWQHNRSALVHLMLLDGYKYIMCEVAEEDRGNNDSNSHKLFIIVETIDLGYEDGRLCFRDIEGYIYSSDIQAINNNGTVMTYDDYLMLKQIKGNNFEQRH